MTNLRLPENITSPITLIVKYRGELSDIPRELYISLTDLGSGFALVETNAGDVPAFVALPQVIYAQADKLLTFEQIPVQGTQNAYYCNTQTGLDGSGVMLGIIDSPVDIKHPIFASSDISYYGEMPDLPLPHGTNVAGVAAQAAPKAKLVCIGINEKGTDFAKASDVMRAVAQLVDMADGMPLVINISYGTNDGSHNGDSLFEEYLNSVAQNSPVAIVVSAGNLGNASRHFYGVSDGRPVTAEIGVKTGGFTCGIWKNFADDFSVRLTAPNNETFTLSTFNDSFYFHGKISVFNGTPTPYSLDTELFISFSSAENGIWQITLFPRELATKGAVNMWLSANVFTLPEQRTTITIPALAQRVISAAAYDPTQNVPAPFSGRGLAANGLYKPDLAAPGVGIYTAAPGGGYTTVSGTSFAAPFVSGACAQLMQWGMVLGNDPFLYGQRLKAFLQKGCRRLPGLVYPDIEWGYGSLCIERTLELLKKEQLIL